jgi:hypothetical protein
MRSCIVRALAAIGTCLFVGTVNAADIYSPMTPELQQTVTEGLWTFPLPHISEPLDCRATLPSSGFRLSTSMPVSATSSTILSSVRWQ